MPLLDRANISTAGQKIKKVQAIKLVKSNKSKNMLCEIAFLALLNFFSVQKLKLQKMEFGQIKFFVKLIYNNFTSFFSFWPWTFLIFWPAVSGTSQN